MNALTEIAERYSGLIIAIAATVVSAGITASVWMLWTMQGSVASLTTAQRLILQDVAEIRSDLSGTYTDREADRDHADLQRQIDGHEDSLRDLDGRVRELEQR